MSYADKLKAETRFVLYLEAVKYGGNAQAITDCAEEFIKITMQRLPKHEYQNAKSHAAMARRVCAQVIKDVSLCTASLGTLASSALSVDKETSEKMLAAAKQLDREGKLSCGPVLPMPPIEYVAPAHYASTVDPIAFAKANMPKEQVEGFLRINAIKYLTRYDKKGTPKEALAKAKHYLDMLAAMV